MTDRVADVPSIVRVLSHRPAGLLSDIDGTLSHIAPRPDMAVVDLAAREALQVLVRKLDVVAVVTGRSARDAARMIGVEGLLYIGNHGMEQLVDDVVVVHPAAAAHEPAIAAVLTAVRERVRIPGVIVESKVVTGSVHFRAAPDPAAAEAAVRAVLEPLAQTHGCRLTSGRMVIEVRPPVDRNKGTALDDVVAEYSLASAAFIGDDVTDLDAMRRLNTLRDAGRVDGIVVGVVGSETPPAIAAESDIVVPGVDGVVALLQALAEALPEP